MRAEDQLEAEEEEEALEIVQGLEEGRDDEQAEEQALEDLPAAAREFQGVVATMRAVLEGRAVDLEAFTAMSRDEREALEVLEQVVSARDRRGTFIYAEHRIERLNQVLSVLQPALSIGNVDGIEVQDDLARVIDEVTELRAKLNQLDSAEEELGPVAEEREAEGDKDDDDGDDALVEVPEPGAPARPSILSAGPAVPDKASPKTTLTGAAVPDRTSPPTTLTGSPAAPDRPVQPTTLTGGPEAPAFEPGPSTLAEEPAAADAKPARGRKAK